MKLINLIPLKEITRKQIDKEREHFRTNLGGQVWEDAIDEIDDILGEIDDIEPMDNRGISYDTTKEYDDFNTATYNYFLPHLAWKNTKPEKVKNSVDKLYNLYSKKLDNRYKELKNNLDSATKALKNKIK